MKFRLLAATALGLLLLQHPALASSHREAPMIAGMPRLDASDFFLFRSYEPNRANYVTMIADYVPLQDPGGGPNFYDMEHDGYYDINVDSDGTGKPTYTFRSRFYPVVRNTTIQVAGKNVAIPTINSGVITPNDDSKQNVGEVYSISLITYRGGVASESLLKDTGGKTACRSAPVA